MKNQLLEDRIIKQGKAELIKSRLNLASGILCMTPTRVFMKAKSPAKSGFFEVLIAKKARINNHGFNLYYGDIKKIERGRHGSKDNVIELTNKDNRTYKIIVDSFSEWENAISQYL